MELIEATIRFGGRQVITNHFEYQRLGQFICMIICIYIHMDSTVMATVFTLKVTCGVLLRCLRLLGCSPLSPGLSLAQPTVIPPCFLSSFWEVSSLDFPLPSGHCAFLCHSPSPSFQRPSFPSKAHQLDRLHLRA